MILTSRAGIHLHLTGKLEELELAVILPQRDCGGRSKPPYNEITNDELRQAIFEVDRDKIPETDVFLFVLDSRVPDESPCVELVIAYGQKHLLLRDKLLIGL